jgi:hypothetical protein
VLIALNQSHFEPFLGFLVETNDRISSRYKLSGSARRNCIFVPDGIVKEPTDTPVRACRVVLGFTCGWKAPSVLIGTVWPPIEMEMRFTLSGSGRRESACDVSTLAKTLVPAGSKVFPCTATF